MSEDELAAWMAAQGRPNWAARAIAAITADPTNIVVPATERKCPDCPFVGADMEGLGRHRDEHALFFTSSERGGRKLLPVNHGTGHAYRRRGCRCDDCTRAVRECAAAAARRARAKRPPPAPKKEHPIQHGTRTGYQRGCRCEHCRAAQTAYETGRRYRMKPKARPVVAFKLSECDGCGKPFSHPVDEPRALCRPNCRKRIRPVEPERQPTGHMHRWRIETPNGPLVRGVCRECGAERDFPTAWEGDRTNVGSLSLYRKGMV